MALKAINRNCMKRVIPGFLANEALYSGEFRNKARYSKRGVYRLIRLREIEVLSRE